MRSVPLHDVNDIQQVFDATDLDAIVILSPRNLWLLTGAARAFGRTPGYRRNSCAIAFRNAEPLLITGRFQEEPSLIFSWVNQITTYSDYLESPLTRASEVLMKRGLGAGKIGIEARAHTTEFYDDLAAGLPGAQFIPCDDLLETVWTIKQPKELDVLERGLQKLSGAIAEALAQSKAGDTENTIHKRILSLARRTGTASVWGTLVSGERLPALRGLPGERVLQAGDLFRIDYSLAERNYPARICRMGVVGGAADEQRDSYQRFVSTLNAATRQVTAGQTGGQIFDLVNEELRKGGFEPAGESFGGNLGVGLYLERPIIRGGETYTAAPNMILSVEPAEKSGYKASQEIRIVDAGNVPIAGNTLPSLEELLIIP
jgi:Xaa-Pro dipeptidase